MRLETLRRRSRAREAPREAPCLETLEPRVLYSADPLAGALGPPPDEGAPAIVVEPSVTATRATAATPLAANAGAVAEARRDLVIVTANVPDPHAFEAALGASRAAALEVVVLDAGRDALTQIGELLSTAAGPWDAVHLVSHAAPGRIDLGSSVGDRYLDDATLAARFDEIAAWGAGFAADGDLLLYGCDLAGSATGESLLAGLGGLLGVDVAASTDTTGAAALGGDWTLEYAVGAIAPDAALAAAHWSFTLDTVTANVFNDVVDGNTGSIAALIANPGLDGGISLREAVLAANATGATDTITLLAGTYTLNSQLVVNQHLGITGASAGTTFIDGGGTTRLFEVTNDSLLLQKLTLQKGAATNGGALLVGTGVGVTLEEVVLRDNAANLGGAVYSLGTLVATNVSFTHNTAGGSGGGLYLHGGSAAVTNATFSGNVASASGGAIFSNRPLSLTSSTVAYNVASGGVGGIFQGVGNNAILSNTLLADNTGGNANRALVSTGFNLDSDGSAGLAQGTDLSGVAAKLNPLSVAANGLYTHTPQNDSPAVDAGGGTFLPTDAAGLVRNAMPDIGASENLAASRGKLYWADRDRSAIVRANLDGSAMQSVVTGLSAPRGFAIDAASRHIYWTDTTTKSVQRANLDGSGQVTFISGLLGPYGLDVDLAGRHLYFADDGGLGTNDFLRRVDLDGTNLIDVVATSQFIRGVAVAPAVAPGTGSVFVTDAGSHSIVRGNLDGTASVVIASGAAQGVNQPLNIAVDTVNNRVYWVNDGTGDGADSIVRANFDGTGRTTILSALGNPQDIVIDAQGEVIYWVEKTTGQVGRADLDGGNVVRFSTGSSVGLRDLGLYTFPVFNAAPSGADATLTILEDAPRTLAAADFGFTDTDGHAFAGVALVSLPLAGSLTLDGAAVTAGQFVTAADIAANKLVFTPVANANGANHASFTFRVRDDGGTANGGIAEDQTANTLTFNVTAVNDAPAGTDNTVTILEGTPRDLTAADFGFSDLEAHAFDGVRIVGLPGAGSLTLGGVAVTANQVVTAAQISAGSLVFVPGVDANGANHASFTFRVRDAGGTANGGVDEDPTANTLIFDVTAVNDAPSGADATLTILEDTPRILTAADFGFSDFSDFEAHAFDGVRIVSQPWAGSLTLGGVAVTANQVVTAAQISAGSLVFTPGANANGANHASFTFRVRDAGGTANDGVDEDPTANTLRFNVTAVNDAPSGADATLTILEDGPRTLTAADFAFTDVEGHGFAGMVLASGPSAGSLTLDGAAVTAGQFVTAADIAANKLVFTPVANANGANHASFTFRVRDDGGTANGGVNQDATPNTLRFDVTAMNDAPSGTDATLTILEDAPHLLTAADFGFTDTDGHAFAGVTLASLPLAGSLTLDGAAVTTGQFVTAADIAANKLVFTPVANANGANHASFTFRVRDDGGTANGGVNQDATPNTLTFNVTAVNDAPSGTDATLTILEDGPHLLAAADFGFTDTDGHAFAGVTLASLPLAGSLTLDGAAVTAGQFVTAADIAANKLVFTPVANANGANHASFTFRVRDDGGTANGGVNQDATPNTLRFDVTAVNDAPSGANRTIAINEDTPYALAVVDFGFTDVDAGLFSGVFISSLPVAGGLTLDGVDVTLMTFVDVTSLAAGKLVFTPAANASGANHASFTFQVRDTGGAANGGVDIDPTPNTLSFDVAPVNDAPAGTDAMIPILEDTPRTLTAADFGYSDLDEHAFDGVRIVSPPGAGSLTLAGVAVAANQVVSATDLAAGSLVFTPATNANGANHASLTFRVRDAGGTANGGIDEDPTANTLRFDVTAVNDAPAGTDATLTILEDTPRTLTAADFGFSDLEGHAIDGVRIVSLPEAGSLTLGGVAVAANQVVTAAQVSAGSLVFTPGANANGANHASFSFRVRDDGGTANGGIAEDQTANTLRFYVTAVNDVPVGSDWRADVATERFVLTPSQFAFRDADGQTLAALRIDSLPAEGRLLLGGQPIGAGAVVSVADLAAGSLVFDAGEVSARAVGFTFSVGDGARFDVESRRATLAFAEPPAMLKQMMQQMMQDAMEGAMRDAMRDAMQDAMQGMSQLAPMPVAQASPVPAAPRSLPADAPAAGSPMDSASSSVPSTPSPAAGPADAVTGDPGVAVVDPTVAAAFTLPSTAAGGMRALVEAVDAAIAATPQTGATVETARRAVVSWLAQAERAALEGQSAIGTLLAEIVEHSRALGDGSDAAGAFDAGHAAGGMAPALENPGFIETLDALRADQELAVVIDRGVLGGGVVASTGVSVGYVLWLLRGEFLLSGLLSSLPAWRMVDPLPVLAQLGEGGADDDESLEQLVGGEQAGAPLPDAGDESMFTTLGDYT